MVTVGTSRDDWPDYRALAAARPGQVAYTAGLHPCDVGPDWAEQVALLRSFWSGREGPPPVALGECGLDRFHLPKDDPAAEARLWSWQQEAFAAQLQWARELGCTVVVHSRGAFADCLAAIDRSGVAWDRVVLHCFVEGAAGWAELAARGGAGSWTGILTYKSADEVRAGLVAAGPDRAMFETDAPYLAPVPHRGQPNEPSYLAHTVTAAAILLGVAPADLAERSSARARRFYGD